MAKKSVAGLSISTKSKKIKKDKEFTTLSKLELKKWKNRLRGKTLDLKSMGVIPIRTPKPSLLQKESKKKEPGTPKK